MAAALCYGSRGGGAQLDFHHQVGAYDTDALIGAMEQLRRGLGGKGDPAVGRAARPPQPGDARLATSPAVLAGGGAAAWLRPRAEPGGAAVRHHQGVELANLAGDNLQEVTAAAERGIQRIRARIWPFVPALLRPVPIVSNGHVTGTGEPLPPFACGA